MSSKERSFLTWKKRKENVRAERVRHFQPKQMNDLEWKAMLSFLLRGQGEKDCEWGSRLLPVRQMEAR